MVAKKSKTAKKSALYVRCAQREGGFPAELLGRINAAAELLQMDRDDFVTELLRLEMEILEKIQKETQAWWKSKTEVKNNNKKDGHQSASEV